MYGLQPTMLSWLAPALWRYLLEITLASIAILILPTALSFSFAGFVLGMIVRDLQRYLDLAQLWPMY